MAKWWRKILLVIVAGGLFCLLGACNQAQVPEIVQSDDGQEVNQSYEQDQQEISQTPLEEEPVSTGEWFNDDWRDNLPSPDNQAYVVGDLLIMPLANILGIASLLSYFQQNAWLGFLQGAILTSLAVLVTMFFTKIKWFWRT